MSGKGMRYMQIMERKTKQADKFVLYVLGWCFVCLMVGLLGGMH
jgi:hypothetical protein